MGLAQFEHEGEILKMRDICQNSNGFLSILKAPAPVKSKIDVWGYNGNALKLMQGIKEQFDNKNILNPGRFIWRIRIKKRAISAGIAKLGGIIISHASFRY